MVALVVSDLHVDATRPEIAQQFCDFLAGEARAASALYVLGDLFESWLGDDDPCPHKRAVVAALRALSVAGGALYFMHGNRDFMLGKRFCRETGGTLLADPTVANAAGRRVLLTHGDALCTDDLPYQRLRALLRDPVVLQRLHALKPAQRAALASEARAGSRAHVARQPAMLMDVNQATVVEVLRASGADTLVHGHTHRPGVHRLEVDGVPRRRIVTGDWYTQGSVLRWDGADFELAALARR